MRVLRLLRLANDARELRLETRLGVALGARDLRLQPRVALGARLDDSRFQLFVGLGPDALDLVFGHLRARGGLLDDLARFLDGNALGRFGLGASGLGGFDLGARLRDALLAIAPGPRFRDVEFGRQHLIRFLADPADFFGELLLALAADAFELGGEALSSRGFSGRLCLGHRRLALLGRELFDSCELLGALLRGFRFDTRNLTRVPLGGLGLDARQLRRLLLRLLRFLADSADLRGKLRLALPADRE